MHKFLAISIGLIFTQLWFAPPSYGQTIKSYSYSNDFYKVTQSGNNVSIYAGSTQSICSTPNGVNTCDTCSQQWATVALDGATAGSTSGFFCNRQQVYPTLKFQVTITFGEDFPASCSTDPKFTAKKTSGTASSISMAKESVSSKTATYSLTWSQICGDASPDSDCRTSFPLTEYSIGYNSSCSGDPSGETLKIKFGLRSVENSPPTVFGCNSEANRGVCYFTVYPGDQKVYIRNIKKSSESLPTANQYDTTAFTDPLSTTTDDSGFKYIGIRVFYESGSNFSNITLSSPSADLKFDSTGELGNNGKITGLENNQAYSFLIANLDEAGNVSMHSEPTRSGGTVTTNTVAMSATPGYGTTQGAMPEEVYGLLDGKKCFIATAAYGNENAGDVELLRKFRNQYLLPSAWGQKFVRFYYKNSPPIAEFIAQRPWLRLATWIALKPFIWMADLFVNPAISTASQVDSKTKKIINAQDRNKKINNGGSHD